MRHLQTCLQLAAATVIWAVLGFLARSFGGALNGRDTALLGLAFLIWVTVTALRASSFLVARLIEASTSGKSGREHVANGSDR